jgi:hypothetical protein
MALNNAYFALEAAWKKLKLVSSVVNFMKFTSSEMLIVPPTSPYADARSAQQLASGARKLQ